MRDKERVFQAADELAGEGTPVTVTTVRERAGCSNAAATRYLREWREERRAQEQVLPELPASVTALVTRGVENLWGAAVQAARAEHEQEAAAADEALTAVVGEADALAARVDEADAELAQLRAVLESAREHARAAQEERAETERQRADAAAASARLEADLAAARAELETVRAELAEQRAATVTADRARADAEAVVALALEDQGVDPASARLDVRCDVDPCGAGGSLVRTTVRLEVVLPGVPALLAAMVPARVPVEATGTAAGDRFAGAP
ncbi:hypothetical protein HLB15_22155 [Promicromonospora citrea]|uniref:DNA-binding protein n=1 Tax=Promicromonospora citrea TaxID=43677 RepID=UPI0014886CDD|nr:DNA-binding protein [Promicromonospora citrea]NNH54928.1 hypothetical protein [Promicromonospora citrea]